MQYAVFNHGVRQRQRCQPILRRRPVLPFQFLDDVVLERVHDGVSGSSDTVLADEFAHSRARPELPGKTDFYFITDSGDREPFRRHRLEPVPPTSLQMCVRPSERHHTGRVPVCVKPAFCYKGPHRRAKRPYLTITPVGNEQIFIRNTVSRASRHPSPAPSVFDGCRIRLVFWRMARRRRCCVDDE
jgi:hypothetical protein